MELLLSQPDIAEEENQITVAPTTVYSHDSTFIPFRQFRQKYFQPNPTVNLYFQIKSLIIPFFFRWKLGCSITRRHGIQS